MSNLSTDCLGKTPLTKDAVQVIFELREDNRPPAVLQTWVKNLCLSHERLRAELAGAEHLWQQAQAVVDRLREQIKLLEAAYENSRGIVEMSTRVKLFNELNILKRILGDYK